MNDEAFTILSIRTLFEQINNYIFKDLGDLINKFFMKFIYKVIDKIAIS